MTQQIEWLPTEPPRPAPALMTAVEAATYLRLTENDRDVGDSLKSLEYLVSRAGLRACRIGRCNRYSRVELDRFIAHQTEQYGASGRLHPSGHPSVEAAAEQSTQADHTKLHDPILGVTVHARVNGQAREHLRLDRVFD